MPDPNDSSLARFIEERDMSDDWHPAPEERDSMFSQSDRVSMDTILAHVGEIVETSTTELVAEACRLNQAPPFGQFVRVASDIQSIGLVFNTVTRSIDPSRRPTAYGRPEEQLRAEQPQIFELLRTHFEILVIGYLDGDKPLMQVPPQPARIHSFVYPCEAEVVIHCSEGDEFLRSILRAPRTPSEDLLVASVRFALLTRGDDATYAVQVSKEISRLLRDDYDRLSSVIGRLARLTGHPR